MPKPFRLPLSFLFAVVVATLVLSDARPRVASGSPYTHEQVLWASYWTVEPGFTSTLEMKNNRINEALTVQPSLYFASGEEYYLAPIQMGPRQTVIVSLNRVMAELPLSVAARAGKEGSLEIEFEATSASALMGSVSVTNPEKGIAWNFFMYPTNSAVLKVPVGGVFSLPNDQADGFVVAHNASEEPMTLSPRFWIAGQSYSLPPIALTGGQGYKLELRKELRRLGLSEVTTGGLEFTHEGTSDALKAHGVLFDGRGFSAEIDFTRIEVWQQPRLNALRTPRFAIGLMDPTLGLPSRTRFEPLVALHNFNTEALALTLSVGYRNGAGPQELQLPVVIGPGDTQVLRLHQYLREVIPANQPWASLEVSYTANRNGLAAMMVSTSQDGARSIRSVLNWVEGATREGWYWRVGTEHNTLLGIYNPDTEAARLAVRLDYYVDGARRTYEFPEMLVPPRSSELVDIGGIIKQQLPDTNGQAIPPGVSFGGYRVRKLDRLGINITTEALVIDRRAKNYLTIYNTACCHGIATTTPSSLVGFVGGQGQLYVSAYDYCSESEEDLTWQANYGSDNGDVAYAGGAGAVQYTGPGFTTVYSSVIHYRDWGSGSCSTGSDLGFCGVTVRPKIVGPNTVWYFGGSNPSGYATQITLNSLGGSSGTWTVTSGANKVNLSTTTGSQTTVTSSGAAFSSAVGDIKITLSTNGQTSEEFSITTRTPHRLVAGTITHTCSTEYGYLSLLEYTIQDQLLTNVPSDVPLNEKWFTAVVNDYAGTNWRRGDEGSTTAVTFQDQIGGESRADAVPVPGCAGNSTAVQHWGQEWRVGSLTIGGGRRVQSNTLQKNRDFAVHTQIVSPAP